MNIDVGHGGKDWLGAIGINKIQEKDVVNSEYCFGYFELKKNNLNASDIYLTRYSGHNLFSLSE